MFGLGDERVFGSAGGVSVHFIDVGQGDCALIKTQEKNILIDCGEREYYNTVLNYLKKQGVTRLDYVIISHPHSDHMGAMSYIIDELNADTLIMPKVKDELVPVTSSFGRLLDSVSRSGTQVVYAKPETRIELDNGSSIELLSPLNDYDDLNNYSVVVKLIAAGYTFLFTGDIEKDAENDILKSGFDISADVLKVAHHGSSTSSKAKFLNTVDADYAVINVGSPNSYNHPNDDVINRLIDRGYTIFRTDLHGDIVFDCTDSGLEIYTQKESGRDAA